jgi:1-phosphofructokinase family hexose kinase
MDNRPTNIEHAATAMILCVTLNPCLDRTLTVPPWRPGDLVRGTGVREVVGGKGNNVARALKRLGRTPQPVTFLGGPTGALCESLLREVDGLEPIVEPTAAATREILTVRTEASAEQTAFFDPDPQVTVAEAESLLRRAETALTTLDVEALTLSGSSPAPATHTLYSDLISLAHARRIPVFLDTYGPALSAIWGFWPTAIQLNRREAAGHLRKPQATESDITGLLQVWNKHRVSCGIVTDGARPLLVLLHGKSYRVTPPAIKPVNPIGSGDSLLAGLVDGWLAQLAPERLMRHAVACGVANALVWDAGAIEPAEVARWEEQIQIEPLARAG